MIISRKDFTSDERPSTCLLRLLFSQVMLFISSLSALIVSRRSLSFFVAEHDFTPNPDNDAMTDIKRNTEISFHVVDDSESSIAPLLASHKV